MVIKVIKDIYARSYDFEQNKTVWRPLKKAPWPTG